MSKVKIEVLQCDFCIFNSKKPLDTLATRKCEVCEKDLCDNTIHSGDTYSSTQHMDNPMDSFVCSECWKLLDYNGYKSGTSPLPKGGVNKHASGSTMAINIAEFRAYIEGRYREIGQEAVLTILRTIHSGLKVKFDIEDEKKKLQLKFDEEMKAIQQRKLEEL